VTKPVTLDVTLNYAGPHPMNKKPYIGIAAVTTVKRTDFGVSYGAPVVSEDITIEIQSEMAKKS
jgi:polyisoprenoid-binding protein YceI